MINDAAHGKLGASRRSNDADRAGDALHGPIGRDRDAADCDTDAADLPDGFVEPSHHEQNRPDGQDDHELTDLDANVEGQEALPKVR